MIQDVDIPLEHAPEFLDFFQREIGIVPVWICPIGAARRSRFPLYPVGPRRAVRQFRLLGRVRTREAHPRRALQPPDRAQGDAARRHQVALLGQLLLARGVRRATAARPTRAQGEVRPGGALSRPLREVRAAALRSCRERGVRGPGALGKSAGTTSVGSPCRGPNSSTALPRDEARAPPRTLPHCCQGFSLAASPPHSRSPRSSRCRQPPGAEDRGRRRRHVDRSALLQPVPEQQHRRAHLRQARADGSRLADDPGPRDVVEGDRRHDLGVQAAQGRQVPRRQRAHRRGRRVLDRPRAAVPNSPGPFSRVHEGDRRQGDRRSRTRSASSTRRRIRSRRTTCRRSTSCRRRSRPAPRPRTSTRARRRSAAAATSSSATSTATASSSCATTPTGARSRRWDKVTFRIIKNEPARVAALLSGDVDAIEQPPTADLARHQGRPAVHASRRSLAPRDLLQLRPPRARRARSSPARTASRSTRIRCSTCACATRSRRRSTARRSPSA